MRKLAAEFVSTFILVFLAVGAAVYGTDQSGVVGVALAFGLVLFALCYAIGPISGCHVNPAVTMGMLLSGRLSIVDAVGYWVAQLLGGIAGGAMLKFMVTAGGVTDQTGALGTNAYGDTVNLTGAVVIEIVLTFLLVFVVLAVTGRRGATPAAGAAIGLALAIIHIVGIPLTGTSVNPARSLGPALFNGGEAISQLWVFIVAPLVGGILAAGFYPLLFGSDKPEPQSASD
ncbi:MAG: MIP/aquaporin family protein [Stackebrandtia sp.]